MPRPPDDGRKSLNRGIIVSVGKATICFQEEVTSFTLEQGMKRVVQDPEVCRVCRKLLGIQWRHRGPDASESNFNLVFKETS